VWPEAVDAAATVRFVMLDVDHQVIRERLRERYAAKAKPKKAARALVRFNRELADVLRYQVTQQRNGIVVPDAHEFAVDVLADTVAG
jgi:pantothenate kinase